MELQWPLILFTFFNCLTGGIILTQGVLTLVGKGKKMQLASLVATLVSLAVGGIAVTMHLENPMRIFNAFGALLGGNGTDVSGITLELWAIVVVFVILVLSFLFMRRSEEGLIPKWCAVLCIVGGIALPVVTGDSYLMESLPSWDTPLLPLYYLANALLLGGLAALVISIATKCEDANPTCLKIACVGALATLVVTIIYAVYISMTGDSYTDATYYFDPTLPDVGMVDTESYTSGILSGAYAVLFWLGNVIVGCVVPAVFALAGATGKLAAFKLGDGNRLLAATIVVIVCAVIGSFVWRCLLYLVAIHVFPFY